MCHSIILSRNVSLLRFLVKAYCLVFVKAFSTHRRAASRPPTNTPTCCKSGMRLKTPQGPEVVQIHSAQVHGVGIWVHIKSSLWIILRGAAFLFNAFELHGFGCWGCCRLQGAREKNRTSSMKTTSENTRSPWVPTPARCSSQ